MIIKLYKIGENMKKKVLHVSGSLGMGGVETIVMNIVRGIDKEKYEIAVLVYGNDKGEFENEFEELGGKILRVDSPGNNYIKFYKDVKNMINKNGPFDIIHSHTLHNSGIILKVAYSLNIPIRIAHAHDNLSHLKEPLVKRFYQFLMKKNLNKYSTKLLACSRDAGNYLFGEKEFSDTGEIILNGIDIEKFLFNEKKRYELRSELNIKNEYVIGHVGRFEEQKNQLFLLEIFKEVTEHNSNVKLLLIGDGSLKEQIVKKINQLNLNDFVILTGTRKDTHNLFSTMDLFVLPSIHEGLGIVLIEAQANGLTCIAEKGVVPEEAVILNSFVYLEQNIGKKQWIKSVIEKLSHNRQKNPEEIIVNKGYSVEDLPHKIQNLYSKLLIEKGL